MDRLCEILLGVMIPATATFFIAGAVPLFLRSAGNRSRKVLGLTMLIWGMLYILTTFISYVPLSTEPHHFHIMQPAVLFIGSFAVLLTSWFPTEIVRPGWVDARRAILVSAPLAGTAILYCLICWILGQEPEKIEDLAEFGTSLNHFNVWFRLVILGITYLYVVRILYIMNKYSAHYHIWKDNHFADEDKMNIDWIKAFDTMYFVITVLYTLVVFFSSPCFKLLHCIAVIVSFSIAFYNGLFHKNPFPEGFFEDTSGHEGFLISGTSVQPTGKGPAIQDDSFTSRIPEYAATLTQWMESEKPYLHKDFKLADVSRVLPLNRTYLSIIFNDGLGKCFSEAVNGYRISHARELLESGQEIPIADIAELCGFSSSSSFCRIFARMQGTSPKKYRLEYRMNRYSNKEQEKKK